MHLHLSIYINVAEYYCYRIFFPVPCNQDFAFKSFGKKNNKCSQSLIFIKYVLKQVF